MQFLRMCSSASMDSTNCGLCGTVVLIIEKNLHISEFKPTLFKGQLYLVKIEMKTDRVTQTCKIICVYVKFSH